MRAKGFLSPLFVLLAALFVSNAVVPADTAAGDIATFQTLGFSRDARMFMFAQYGIDEKSSLPYAELYVVDVAANRFVAGGVRRETYSNPVEPGDSGIGALFALLGESGELVRRHRIDHTLSGRLVYILLNGAEPKHDLEFRDFQSGLRYRITLIQDSRVSGSEVEASFHLRVTIEKASGDSSTYTVGLPDFWRKGVRRYRIKQVTLAPDNRSLVFVIEREERDSGGDNIRYMIETLKPSS
jgi:predicted secreted protein